MRFIAGIVGFLAIGLIVLLICAGLAKGAEPSTAQWAVNEPMRPGELAQSPCLPISTAVGCVTTPPAIFIIDDNGIMHPKPLSAIMVSQCGGALALFIQVDANHLLRADPRQSDVFANVDGKMEQSTVGPLEWGLAYSVAAQAVITTHVVVPCDSKEATT